MKLPRRPRPIPATGARLVATVHAIAVTTTRGETPERVVDLVLVVDGQSYTAARLWGPLDGVRLGAPLPAWVDGPDLVVDWSAHPMGARRRRRTSRATPRHDPAPPQVTDTTLGIERSLARGRRTQLLVTHVELDRRRFTDTTIVLHGTEPDGEPRTVGVRAVPFYAEHLPLDGASLPIVVSTRRRRPGAIVDWATAATRDAREPG